MFRRSDSTAGAGTFTLKELEAVTLVMDVDLIQTIHV
jgi:hypothetical protein